MKQCIHFRNESGCRWCDQGLHIQMRNGVCICSMRLDDDSYESNDED